MSRRNPSLGELLILAPWWLSAVLAVLSYIGVRWVLPMLFADNAVLEGVAKGLAGIAWLPALAFAFLAVLSAILGKRKRAMLDAQTGIESLRALGWKQFEDLVGEAYRRQGYDVEESLGGGPDGGIDLILRKGGGSWLVQCKQWKVFSVGAPVIREIYGLVAHHHASGAIVITSGKFTRDAESFASGKPIELIDGPKLLQLVQAAQNPAIVRPSVSVSGPGSSAVPSPSPITAPSCPSCGGGMVKRVARKGANAGNSFWGCANYPSCKGVRNN